MPITARSAGAPGFRFDARHGWEAQRDKDTAARTRPETLVSYGASATGSRTRLAARHAGKLVLHVAAVLAHPAALRHNWALAVEPNRSQDARLLPPSDSLLRC